MIKNTSIFLIFIVFFSCQNVEQVDKPEHLISEEKMVNVLVDMAKLDASISYNSIQFEKREVNPKDLIFEKYEIDSAQLANSSNYYAEDFEVNQRIYDSVRNRLEREKVKIDSLIKQKEKAAEEKKKSKEKNIQQLNVREQKTKVEAIK